MLRELIGATLVLLLVPLTFAESDTAPTDDADLSVEDILTREPDQGDYVDETDCLPLSRIRRMEVLDDQHVTLQVGRDDFYLIQLPRRCPGLQKGNPVIYETQSGRLCRHDTIQGTSRFGLGGVDVGARCQVGPFQSITKEEIVLLKETLAAEKRQRREQRKAQRAEKRKARQKAKEAEQQSG